MAVSLAAAAVLLGLTIWTLSDRTRELNEQARHLQAWRGEPVPEFEITLIADGRPSTLRALHRDGQSLMVVFVKPDCPACRSELEVLRAEAPAYVDRVRIVVVGITDRASTEGLAPSAGSALWVAWDSAAAFRRGALGASIVPVAFIADPSGIITDVVIGARPREFVGALLASLAEGRDQEPHP